MSELEILKNVNLKIPEGSELVDAAKVFLNAFEITDLSVAKDVKNFWRSIEESKV
jgi:hypothetical protein